MMLNFDPVAALLGVAALDVSFEVVLKVSGGPESLSTWCFVVFVVKSLFAKGTLQDVVLGMLLVVFQHLLTGLECRHRTHVAEVAVVLGLCAVPFLVVTKSVGCSVVPWT